jgi:uncharacterized UBP type Zn finger protein
LTHTPLACHVPPICSPAHLLALQDAQEYFGHLLEVVAQAEAAAGGRLPSGDAVPPTESLFKFGTEDRIQCSETGRVGEASAEDVGGATGEGERKCF